MTNKKKTIPCPHCGARYKAPEHIPESGGLVVCSKCGETFTIFPEHTTNDEQFYRDFPEDQFADSFVMREDGSILSVASQAVLQQYIVTMKVGKNDSWSRDKKHWRPLSEEDALEPFFELVSLKVTVGKQVAPAPKPLPSLSVNVDDVGDEQSRKMSRTLPPQSITASNMAPPPDESQDATKFLEDEFEEFEERPSSKRPLIVGFVVVVFVIGAVGAYIRFFSSSTAESDRNFHENATNPNVHNQVAAAAQQKVVVEKPVEIKDGNKDIHPSDANEKPKEIMASDNKKSEPKVKQQPKQTLVKSVSSDSVAKKTLAKAKKRIHYRRKNKTAKKNRSRKVLSVRALLDKGWRLIDSGYYPKALRLFKSVLKKRRATAEAYYGMAEAYGAMGNSEKARIYYKKCLASHPNAKIRLEVQRILENL